MDLVRFPFRRAWGPPGMCGPSFASRKETQQLRLAYRLGLKLVHANLESRGMSIFHCVCAEACISEWDRGLGVQQYEHYLTPKCEGRSLRAHTFESTWLLQIRPSPAFECPWCKGLYKRICWSGKRLDYQGPDWPYFPWCSLYISTAICTTSNLNTKERTKNPSSCTNLAVDRNITSYVLIIAEKVFDNSHVESIICKHQINRSSLPQV